MLYKCINNKSDFWYWCFWNIEEWKEYNVIEEFTVIIKNKKWKEKSYDMIKLDNWNSYQKDRFVLVDKEF